MPETYINNLPENTDPSDSDWILGSTASNPNTFQKTRVIDLVKSRYNPASGWLLKDGSVSPYNASAGDKLLVNSITKGFVINLPASPSFGDNVTFLSVGNGFGINKNGEKYRSSNNDLFFKVNYEEVTLIYTTPTIGWIPNKDVGIELFLATEGFTLDETWDDINTVYSTEARISLSGLIIVDRNSGEDGILIESGATVKGMALYCHNDILYFQCGDGADFGTSNNRIEISTPAPTGQGIEIEFSASSTTGKAALYINRLLVGTDTFSSSYVYGNDGGGIGNVHDAVCVNRGGWVSDGEGIYPNNVIAYIYYDELTKDVE